jgi:hypothetical protein
MDHSTSSFGIASESKSNYTLGSTESIKRIIDDNDESSSQSDNRTQ